MKKIIMLLLVIILTGCNSGREYSRNIFAMDTYINVKLYTDNNNVDYIYDDVSNIYNEYNNLCDRYKAYDGLVNIYYLNEVLKNDERIEIPLKLSEIIEYGLEQYDNTSGLFNIAIGNVSDVWKKYMNEGNRVPSLLELKNSGSTSIDDVFLDDNIYYKKNDVKLDLGGICKGYATEVVGDYLEMLSINKYLINAGGNVKVGKHYEDGRYVIGIQHPEDDVLLTKINVNNKAVVTSGDYQRYYEVDGVRYNHIINPKTLYPTNYSKSVTVISDYSSYGDVMSTYLFLLEPKNAILLVDKIDNLEAIIYVNDKEVLRSKGFSQYEKE